jgi:hypothetical protein
LFEHFDDDADDRNGEDKWYGCVDDFYGYVQRYADWWIVDFNCDVACCCDLLTGCEVYTPSVGSNII